jgi:hypothetical protein
VLAALQFLASSPDYDQVEEDFRRHIASNPGSAKSWSQIFTDHPEFFRRSESGGDYSLVLRRTKPKGVDNRRPSLSSDELSMLIDAAIHLQKHALELRRERRAWLPVMLTAISILGAFVGTILAALIRGPQ